ncbi:MAG: hypothetical protein SVW57_13305 [Thermodesulfobacteriota bacterium]|nr:hypothetical protein [Thermodesulfobacteriota bacterium]
MKTIGNFKNVVHYTYAENKWQDIKQYPASLSQKDVKKTAVKALSARRLEVDISYKDFRVGISRSRVDGFLSTFLSKSEQKAHKHNDLKMSQKASSCFGNTAFGYSPAIPSRGIEQSVRALPAKAERVNSHVDELSLKPLTLGDKSESCQDSTQTLLPVPNGRYEPFSLVPHFVKRAIRFYQVIQNLIHEQPAKIRITV